MTNTHNTATYAIEDQQGFAVYCRIATKAEADALAREWIGLFRSSDDVLWIVPGDGGAPTKIEEVKP